MPIFSEAITRLNAASRYQKSFLPAPLRASLAQCVDVFPNDAQQFGVLSVFIRHYLGEKMRYRWIPALRQFERDLNSAIDHEYSLKPDELIHATDSLPLHSVADQRMSAIYILSKVGLCNTINDNRIQEHLAPFALTRMLYLLSKSRLLNQITVDFVITHGHSVDLSQALTALSMSQLLNEDNLNRLQDRYKEKMGLFLRTIALFRHELLDQANFLQLLRVPAHSMLGVVDDLETLSQMYILSHEHLSRLFRCAYVNRYDNRSEIFSLIDQVSLLSSEMALLLLNIHNVSAPLIRIVRFLSQPSRCHMLTSDLLTTILTEHVGSDLDRLLQQPVARMLNQSNIHAFIHQPQMNRAFLIHFLAILDHGLEQKQLSHQRHVFFMKRRVSLLNPDNIKRIMQHPTPIHLVKIVSILNSTKGCTLSQRDLSALLNHSDILDVERRLTAVCDGSFGTYKQQKEIKALLWGLLEPIAEQQEDDLDLYIEFKRQCHV